MTISCYICHEVGHIASKCSNRGDGRKDKHNGCYICGAPDHQKGFHHDFAHNDPRCSNCNEFGHDAADCAMQHRTRANAPGPTRLREVANVEEDDAAGEQPSDDVVSADAQDEEDEVVEETPEDETAVNNGDHISDEQDSAVDPGEHYRLYYQDASTRQLIQDTEAMPPAPRFPPPFSMEQHSLFPPRHIGTSTARALDRFDEAQLRGRAGLEELLHDDGISGLRYPSKVPAMKDMILAALDKYPPPTPDGITAVASAHGWVYFADDTEESIAAQEVAMEPIVRGIEEVLAEDGADYPAMTSVELNVLRAAEDRSPRNSAVRTAPSSLPATRMVPCLVVPIINATINRRWIANRVHDNGEEAAKIQDNGVFYRVITKRVEAAWEIVDRCKQEWPLSYWDNQHSLYIFKEYAQVPFTEYLGTTLEVYR